MSTRKRGKSRKPRTAADYLQSAKNLSAFAPSLSKYKRRRTLKPSEKAAIARKEKLLKYTDKLVPLTKEQSKRIPKELWWTPERYETKTDKRTGEKYTTHRPIFNSGIRALRLENTGNDVKIIRTRLKKKDFILDAVGTKEQRVIVETDIKSNNRLWTYRSISFPANKEKENRRILGQIAKQAFRAPDSVLPMDEIAERAAEAFAEARTVGVSLYTNSGRVGDIFGTLDEFNQWLMSNWLRYRNTDKWINGIAIQLEGGDELDDYEDDGEENDEYDE